MKIIDAIQIELSHEVSSTQKLFERIPDDKFDWKPHEKSFPMGQLASHSIEMLDWVDVTLNQDAFEFNPEEYKPFVASNTQELLEATNQKLAAAQKIMAACDDSVLMEPWKMIVGGQTVMELPKAAVFRSFIISHLIHHRGQLTVYLRLNDIALPQIYGPTADDPNMFPSS